MSLIGSKFDWGYSTEPDPGLQNRRITFPRGKVHGGSSAVNAMTFIRGHQFCFDKWERLGNPGWGYDALLPIFKKSERHEMGETAWRGADGELAVSLCTDPHAGHRAFLQAAAQHGYQARRALRLQHAVAGEHRRLLPEEHPRRQAAQRRGCVPEAGAVAAQSRSALAGAGDAS